MGFGNSKAAIRDNFIPLIQNYISGKTNAIPSKPVSTNPVAANFKVKVTADELNYREKPDASSKKLGEVKKGEVYTIVETQNGWGFLKSGAGWINLSYTETIEVSSDGTYKVKVTTSSLNIRKGPGASYAKVGVVSKGEVFTIVETRSGWGKLKSGLGWISLAYTEKVK
jgi:N-acetylmuramoyl-L-alanine amidase